MDDIGRAGGMVTQIRYTDSESAKARRSAQPLSVSCAMWCWEWLATRSQCVSRVQARSRAFKICWGERRQNTTCAVGSHFWSAHRVVVRSDDECRTCEFGQAAPAVEGRRRSPCGHHQRAVL